MASKSHPWPEELSYAERMRVVRGVVRKHGAALRRLPNVLLVGVGLEHVRSPDEGGLVPVRVPRHRLHAHDEFVPCVQVLVRKKWGGRRRSGGALPETLRASVSMQGKRRSRVVVDVPVDVVELQPTTLHGWDCSALRDEQFADGSAAALVQFGDWDEPQLLSCHHVLGLTEQQPFDPSLGNVTVTYQGSATGSAVTLPSNPWTCDAALAKSPSPQWTPAPEVPSLQGVLPADQDPPPIFYALTADGVRTVSFVQRTGPWPQSGYAGGKTVTFPEIFITSGQTAGDTFAKGASGGALVTGDGLLVSMHFGGGGRQSLSVPMAAVFSAFPMGVKLWSPSS